MHQISSTAVITFHDGYLANSSGNISSGINTNLQSGIWKWIIKNHCNNSLLWVQEDLARRTRVSDLEIAANKRAIDRYNQARNDAIECIDEQLLILFGLVDADSAWTNSPVIKVGNGVRLNSETVGSMVDRMSILALKICAMCQQVERPDVDEKHRLTCLEKLGQLNVQRNDLGNCLDELLADTKAGRAYFKVYRQFKMYNDPELNPALVAEKNCDGCV